MSNYEYLCHPLNEEPHIFTLDQPRALGRGVCPVHEIISTNRVSASKTLRELTVGVSDDHVKGRINGIYLSREGAEALNVRFFAPVGSSYFAEGDYVRINKLIPDENTTLETVRVRIYGKERAVSMLSYTRFDAWYTRQKSKNNENTSMPQPGATEEVSWSVEETDGSFFLLEHREPISNTVVET